MAGRNSGKGERQVNPTRFVEEFREAGLGWSSYEKRRRRNGSAGAVHGVGQRADG